MTLLNLEIKGHILRQAAKSGLGHFYERFPSRKSPLLDFLNSSDTQNLNGSEECLDFVELLLGKFNQHLQLVSMSLTRMVSSLI